MATYTVTHPASGKKITITGDTPPTKEKLDEIFSQTEETKKTPPTEPTKTPLLGSPLKGPIEYVKGMGATLGEIGKSFKPFNPLHAAGETGKFFGQAVASPFAIPLTSLASTFPRATQAVGRGMEWASRSDAPYQHQPYPGMAVGGEVSSSFAEPARPDINITQQYDKLQPGTKQVIGDVANILSVIPVGQGASLLKKSGTAVAENVAKSGTAVAENVAKRSVVVPLREARQEVSKMLDQPVKSLYESSPVKIKNEYRGPYEGAESAIKTLKSDVQKYGFEKYLVPGKENPLGAQTEALERARTAVEKADKALMDEAFEVHHRAHGKGAPIDYIPIKKNPIEVANKAFEAEKAKGAKGLFSEDRAGRANKKAYEDLITSWKADKMVDPVTGTPFAAWDRSLPVEDLLDFKRNIINKNDNIFNKTSDIDFVERPDWSVRKLVYHSLNDELAGASKNFAKHNQEAKTLHNLAESFEKYKPVVLPPTKMEKYAKSAGMTIGTMTGGGIGYGAGGGVGGTVLGALGGAYAGEKAAAIAKAMAAKKPSPVQRLGTAQKKYETYKSRRP